MKNKNSKSNPLVVSSQTQFKGNSTVKRKIVAVLKKKPSSMLMIEHATGIRRDSNICRRITELEKACVVLFLKKDYCEISKRFVKFYTADKSLFPTAKPIKK